MPLRCGLDQTGTTHTAAGTYNADPWTFTDVSGNYNNTSGTVNDKINKANANCSSIAGYTVTYDGNSHTATGNCNGVDGTTHLTRLDKRSSEHTSPGNFKCRPLTYTDVTCNYNNTACIVNDNIK